MTQSGGSLTHNESHMASIALREFFCDTLLFLDDLVNQRHQDSQGLLVKRVTKDLQVFPGATTCMETLIHCVDSYPIPRLLRPNEGAPASHQWYECQGGQRGISQIGTHCTS